MTSTHEYNLEQMTVPVEATDEADAIRVHELHFPDVEVTDVVPIGEPLRDPAR